MEIEEDKWRDRKTEGETGEQTKGRKHGTIDEGTEKKRKDRLKKRRKDGLI